MGTGTFGGLLTCHPTSASSKGTALGTNSSFFQENEKEKKKGKKTEERLGLFHSGRSLVAPEGGGSSLTHLPPLRGARGDLPGSEQGRETGAAGGPVLSGMEKHRSVNILCLQEKGIAPASCSPSNRASGCDCS